INLASALPDLSTNITIQGPGSASLSVQRSSAVPFSNLFSVFSVSSGATVNISGLTIAGGKAFEGGGINNAGTLTLSNSTLSGNTADFGGGIDNDEEPELVDPGPLTLSNSTLSGNTAAIGGGIYNTNNTFSARNTLIAGNTAPAGPDLNGTLGS